MIRVNGRIRPAAVATMIALVLGGVLSPAGDSAAASAVSALGRNGNSWTGIWKGNDGGVYYLREDASGGLVWLGLSGDGGKHWSNVFTGTIGGSDRNLAVGPWIDVPVGTVRGQGELGLTRKDPNLIVAHRRTGCGFSASIHR